MPAPASATESIVVDIDKIDRSQNYRRSYSDTEEEEMAASIAANGLIHPIVIRPRLNDGTLPVNGTLWWLVAGERRIRGSLRAGKTQILAVVRRDLTEAGAREISLIENLQRKDVDPIEEADGFRELHERMGRSVDEIAQSLGQKKTYVYARLKLCQLGTAGRKMYAAGAFETISVALLVARIPTAELQAAVCKELSWGGVVRFDQAQRVIEQRFMRRLDHAPFDTADEKLVVAAGSCGKCPKRTGNQRELFADIKSGAVCTDTACYAAKADAAWTITAARAEEAGAQVLDGKKAAQLFPHSGQLSPQAPFVDAGAKCYADKKQRTYKKIVAEPGAIVVVRDPDGGVHELIAKKDIAPALKAAGIKSAPAGAAGADEAWKRDQAAARKKQLRKAAGARGLIAAITAAARKAGAAPGAEYFRLLIGELAAHGFTDAIRDVVKQRGWGERGKQPGAIFERRADELAPADLPALVLEVLVTRGAFFSYSTTTSAAIARACKAYRLDAKAIEKAALAALDAKAKEKPKAKGVRK